MGTKKGEGKERVERNSYFDNSILEYLSKRERKLEASIRFGKTGDGRNTEKVLCSSEGQKRKWKNIRESTFLGINI